MPSGSHRVCHRECHHGCHRACHGRPARRGERGSALVLAILILFAMLALGLLAMRTTTQNIAGSGNMRLNKQARYIAESGLYSVLGVFTHDTGQAGELMRQWQTANGVGRAAVIVDDRGGARVVRIGVDGRPNGPPVFQSPAPVLGPAFLASGPNPLGRYGETSGLVSSFEVVVEGFSLWRAPSGEGLVDQGNASDDHCLLHLTSRGYIAEVPVGDDRFENARDDERYAEHTLKAGVVIPVTDGTLCQGM